MHRILIIDDNIDLVTLTQYILKSKGYSTASIGRSQEIFSKVEEFKPHLILMDIMLDGVDSRPFCKQLKENYFVTVLLFSGHAEFIKDFAVCHADGYVQKPFDAEELINTINCFLPQQSNETAA